MLRILCFLSYIPCCYRVYNSYTLMLIMSLRSNIF
nr:MAG TPA: hypothetical protein [Caudoviricetes sp.]